VGGTGKKKNYPQLKMAREKTKRKFRVNGNLWNKGVWQLKGGKNAQNMGVREKHDRLQNRANSRRGFS